MSESIKNAAKSLLQSITELNDWYTKVYWGDFRPATVHYIIAFILSMLFAASIYAVSELVSLMINRSKKLTSHEKESLSAGVKGLGFFGAILIFTFTIPKYGILFMVLSLISLSFSFGQFFAEIFLRKK